MPRQFAVHQLPGLDRELLDQLEAFAREPGRTIDACHEWLQMHGFVVNRSAVGTWKKHFHLTDRFGAANAAAKALMEAAKEGGVVAVADAAILNVSQMLFEKSIEMQESGEVDTEELRRLAMALKNLVNGKRQNESLRGELKTALSAAEKEARKGASGEVVMNKVREILGITPEAESV